MNTDAFKMGEFYYVPSGLPDATLNSLQTQCKSFENALEPSTVGTDESVNKVVESVRISKSYWIPTDHWIASVLSHIVLEANRNYFKFDLTEWSQQIQYTVYNTVGSNYTWHRDSGPSFCNSSEIRKLSISLSISDPADYEGGEFQILGPSGMTTYRLPRGMAVVFPSVITHRVRPIKSGTRRSLVGWFGGPGWR